MGMVLAGKGIAVVSTSWRGGEAGRLARCNIETEAWQPMLRLNTPGTTLAMSPSQDFVATFEKNTVHCIKPHHPDLLKFKMHHTRNITVWSALAKELVLSGHFTVCNLEMSAAYSVKHGMVARSAVYLLCCTHTHGSGDEELSHSSCQIH